jgi:hypothetical protein
LKRKGIPGYAVAESILSTIVAGMAASQMTS